MRELELSFIGKGEVKGFLFKQEFFKNNWYIYSVTFPEQEKAPHYEVFPRREIKALPPFAPVDYVQYPKSAAFGITAWTSSSLEKAKQIVNEKIAMKDEKQKE